LYDRTMPRIGNKEHGERTNSALLRILEEEATGNGRRAPQN
jgi:hypothetical protein